MDETDRMIVEATEKIRRGRQRLALGALGVLMAIVATGVGAWFFRERVVTFTAPADAEHPMRIRIDGRAARVPAGESVSARLRPGTHSISVEGVPAPRTSVSVSLFSFGTTYAPVSDEQCFIDASAGAMYGDHPAPPTVFKITKPGQSVSSGMFSDDIVVGDICDIPQEHRILSSVHVVQPIKCEGAPATPKEASIRLLARFADCRVFRSSLR
jgi:hypothetical protein